jgi:phosphoenolpyruvate carboxylase
LVTFARNTVQSAALYDYEYGLLTHTISLIKV